SLGYATGLSAILARAGDDTVDQILKVSGGDPKLVMDELAKRKLIRPLVTQGHIGDVLTDKIVYDAQTTSGGSGGPLMNKDGRVIGVTFAVVRGVGGAHFGDPVRYAEPLLKHLPVLIRPNPSMDNGGANRGANRGRGLVRWKGVFSGAIFLLLNATELKAYSVLSHQAIIDAAWEEDLNPALLARFPNATPDELSAAQAYAYGGAIIQDLG